VQHEEEGLMVWFKVDDKFPRHRKVRAVRRSHPDKRRDVAPLGLWALAGAESDNGFIAAEILEEWDDDAHELAERLVDAGLWHPATRDGEPGYEFHDWGDQNPADPSTSGTFGNHIKWHKNRGEIKDDCPHCEADSRRANRGDDRGDIGGESLPSRPGPSRPVPNRDADASRADAASVAAKPSVKRATQRPDDFAPSQTHIDLAAELGIDLRAEWQQFCDHHDAKGSTFKDWPAALRTWIRNAAKFRRGGADPRTNNQRHLELARDLAARQQPATLPIGEIQ
jgi:hypothetical protein